MGDAMKKVKPGDALAISAATFNAFVDAALEHQQRQHSTVRGPEREARSAGLVPVRNESGADRGRFDVLGIAGPIITRQANPDFFKLRIALRGVLPAIDHASRFAVLREPVAAGAIGQAWIEGVCPIRIEVTDEAHRFADVEAGQAARLRSAGSGSAALLWFEPVEQREEPTIAWAIVRIGNTGAASGGASLGFCRIESSIGTSPPFIYTARRVPVVGNGQFGSPECSDFDLWNLAEIGAGGTGVHEVPDGAVVSFWQDADTGEYFFDRSFYRGTY